MCVCVCACLQNMKHTVPNCITVYTYVMRFRLVPLHALQTRVTEITEHFVFRAFVKRQSYNANIFILGKFSLEKPTYIIIFKANG